MKWMPPKPDFSYYAGNVISEYFYNEWYAKEIAPIFENAVEMNGRFYQYINYPCEWCMYSTPDKTFATHTGLLINIQPIKKESAEDILRDLFNKSLDSGGGEYICFSKKDFAKAKAFLEHKK